MCIGGRVCGICRAPKKGGFEKLTGEKKKLFRVVARLGNAQLETLGRCALNLSATRRTEGVDRQCVALFTIDKWVVVSQQNGQTS